MKNRLLCFEEFAKDAQPEVLFTLLHSIVERIYITIDGSSQKCHVYIKGCATEDYSDVLGAVRYIKQEAALPVVTYIPPMCDLDYYSIRAKIPAKDILRRTQSRDRENPAGIMRLERNPHSRGRSVSGAYPYARRNPAKRKCSRIYGIS